MTTPYFIAAALAIWLGSLFLTSMGFRISEGVWRSRQRGLLSLYRQSTEMAGSFIGGLLLSLYVIGVTRAYNE
jgi:hypothetical protein